MRIKRIFVAKKVVLLYMYVTLIDCSGVRNQKMQRSVVVVAGGRGPLQQVPNSAIHAATMEIESSLTLF